MTTNPLPQFRRAELHELGLLTAVALESKAHWPYTAAQLELWREDLSITPDMVASGLTWVLEHDIGIAGLFVLTAATPDWILEHCWILPRRMGQGLGRLLFERACELARTGGAEGLSIDSDPNAEGFYLACGARRVSTYAAPIDGDPGRERPLLRLAL
ncbi:MAG: GNAT family N-acetyltransferase [Planctomycetes bacterium]|nr:GNAT family N-acetyltransferase [Planctomycetota bacterium]